MKIIIIILAFFIISCNYDTGGRQPWPGGKVPFILAGFTEEEEVEIIKAMIIWELASGGRVEFFIYGTRATDNKPLYIFKKESYNMTVENMSGVGYGASGLNYTILNMEGFDVILHELGHVLGLNHEHARPDRDLYITVDLDGLPLQLQLQFMPIKSDIYDYRKYPFDYKSIMMYGDGYRYIIDGRGHEFGGNTLSPIDAWKVRDIYSEKTQ